MATHTAGPWRVGPVDDTAVTAADGTEICHASGDGDYDDDAVWPVMEANARLIAAAPDLLALAYQYRDDLRYPPTADSITRRLAAIDAVLAKVKGE